MDQQQISEHFINVARGTTPVKKRGVILLPSHHVQIGRGDTEVTDLKMVSPAKDAVNQAKSDLKRGIEDTDIYENAIRDDVKRKKLSQPVASAKRRSHKKKINRKKKKKKTTGPKKSSKSKNTKKKQKKKVK